MLHKLMKEPFCHSRGILESGSQEGGKGGGAFGFTVAGALTERPEILTM